MNLNVLKGMLIILVIADHNDFTRQIVPGFFLGLTFHVVGFMTIPFLKPAEPLVTSRFAHYAFRLYWPFFLATCGLWLIVSITAQTSWIERISMLPVALYSGNAHILKQVTHMALLWFLPSFITIVTLRNFIDLSRPSVRRATWLLLAAVHLIIGAVAVSVENYLPLGLLPALYIAPLAYIGVATHQRLLEPLTPWIAVAVTAVAFATVKSLQMHWGLTNEVGFSAVADWRDPQALLVNDLEAITGTLMLFQIARFNIGGLLEVCGKYSMQMYLFHAFIGLAIYKMAQRYLPDTSVLILFLGSLALTIVLTLLAARFIMNIDLLRRLVFPRDPADLPRP